MSTKRTGDLGEELAARHLERAGWKILHRNFRVGRLEVDLIAQREKLLAFVEVKARKDNEFGHPLASVMGRKRVSVRKVAEVWITRFGRDEFEYRFDAIAVTLHGSGSPRLQHVENAWGY